MEMKLTEKPLLFLLNLGWESRYRIPLIITVAFMLFDIRMQIDINVQMRTIRRRPRIPDTEDGEDDFDEDSWMSFEDSDDEEEDALIMI